MTLKTNVRNDSLEICPPRMNDDDWAFISDVVVHYNDEEVYDQAVKRFVEILRRIQRESGVKLHGAILREGSDDNFVRADAHDAIEELKVDFVDPLFNNINNTNNDPGS